MTGKDFVTFLDSLRFPRDDAHKWGYQLRFLNTSLYAAKFLIFTNSLPGSLHHHADKKDETFICLAGKVWVECPDSAGCIMTPGDVFHIPYFTKHRSRALEYPAVILEVSTEDSDEYTFRVT
jgi:mannose-6-phosphate isomerase-like protein (cupin superfamily)